MGYILPGKGKLIGKNSCLDAWKGPLIVRLQGEDNGHVPRSRIKLRDLASRTYPEGQVWRLSRNSSSPRRKRWFRPLPWLEEAADWIDSNRVSSYSDGHDKLREELGLNCLQTGCADLREDRRHSHDHIWLAIYGEANYDMWTRRVPRAREGRDLSLGFVASYNKNCTKYWPATNIT